MNSSKMSVPSVVSSCCMNANGERAGASAARSAGRTAVAAVGAVGAGAPRRTLSPTTAACSVVAKIAILMVAWCEASPARAAAASAWQRDLRVGFGHGAARGANGDLVKFIFTLRKAMLFGAVVGAVLAIAELRQLDEVASGTELGSGADNGFLEPPIAPPPLFPPPFTPPATPPKPLELLDALALGFIGFSAGAKFDLAEIRSVARAVLCVMAGLVLVTFAVCTAATPAAARKAARSPLARAAPPLTVPPCSLPPAAGSRASERRV